MNTEPMSELRAAAIEDDGSCDVDALLARLAGRLRQGGRRVRGLIMVHPGEVRTCATPIVLVDLDTARQNLVSQPLGSRLNLVPGRSRRLRTGQRGAQACGQEAPDLVICNRFGGLEAEGGGFRSELIDILAADLPLLTVVATRHILAWQSFTGGAKALPARETAAQAWVDRVRGAPGIST